MIVESYYRVHFTPVLSALSRRYRRVDTDVLLDAVQDAFEAALRFEGEILQPGAWLYRVAENRLRTHLKKINLQAPLTIPTEECGEDRTLDLLYFFTQLEISERNQMVLGLYYIGGLTVKQIGTGLKINPENAKKVLHRSRDLLRATYPNYSARPASAPPVLNLLYLLFNEGYKRSGGEKGYSTALCFEALRLGQMLPDTKVTAALLALFCFHSARLPARVREGAFVPLYAQDRKLWNSELIRQGHFYLQKAKGSIHPYFLEALVSAQHCLSPDFGATPWEQIALLYEKMRPYTEEVRLNHLLALSHFEERATIRSEIQKLAPTFHQLMALAYLYEIEDEKANAAKYYETALQKADNPYDQRFLEQKLKNLRAK